MGSTGRQILIRPCGIQPKIRNTVLDTDLISLVNMIKFIRWKKMLILPIPNITYGDKAMESNVPKVNANPMVHVPATSAVV